MKILFTGMLSSQVKESANKSFFGLLKDGYGNFADVIVSEPRISWTRSDLENFDLIVLGFVPPTALTANHLYGAIHVFNLMYESPKLRLSVDSPQVWQYKNSINFFTKNPHGIFSSFYETRKNYVAVNKSNFRSEAESLAEKITKLEWPKTFIPKLPWASNSDLIKHVQFIPENSLLPTNLDSLVLNGQQDLRLERHGWAVENPKNSWWVEVSKTLSKPQRSVKPKTRSSDVEIESVIGSAESLAIPPQERKVTNWWSYRYVQGLSLGTPIATYWQDTVKFSDSWSKLAYQIEEMSENDRKKLSKDQYGSYSYSIPTKPSILKTLQNEVVGLKKEII